MRYDIVPSLQKKLSKLSKRDKALYFQVLKKIEEVISSSDVEHYKNLQHNMKDKKRVHISHFVLVFRFIKIESKIVFDDFDHHDNIYKQ